MCPDSVCYHPSLITCIRSHSRGPGLRTHHMFGETTSSHDSNRGKREKGGGRRLWLGCHRSVFPATWSPIVVWLTQQALTVHILPRGHSGTQLGNPEAYPLTEGETARWYSSSGFPSQEIGSGGGAKIYPRPFLLVSVLVSVL